MDFLHAKARLEETSIKKLFNRILFATDKGLEKIGFRIIKSVNVTLEQTHIADVRLIVLCTLIITINVDILGTLTKSTNTILLNKSLFPFYLVIGVWMMTAYLKFLVHLLVKLEAINIYLFGPEHVQ
jgi:hypothetical protein